MAFPYLDPRAMAGRGLPNQQSSPRAMTAAASMVPGVGDAIGLLSDASGFVQDPKSLTPATGLLSLAGLVPGVPSWGGKMKKWDGEIGNWRHITGKQEVFAPPQALASIPGEKGEIRKWAADRSSFGNYSAKDWAEFVADVKKRGVVDPILITKDGRGFRVSEGNHRIQAAIQAGIPEIPVEVRYFGKSESAGLLLE